MSGILFFIFASCHPLTTKTLKTFYTVLSFKYTGMWSFLRILLGTSLLLEDTSATVQPEMQTNCNTCCHGPAGSQGTPGIPGVPGTNGMPGGLGPKGDRGDTIKGDKGENIKGDIGPRGENGRPGLKGDRGFDGLQGPPGKVGPQGLAGLVGSPGLPGVKGQKGEMGQSRVSAFTAVRSTSFTPSSGNQALPFEIIHTNVGDDFNAALGRFTCDVPGIYMFTYNILTHTGRSWIQLMKNDDRINSIYRSSETFHDMIGNSAVLQLATGDQVWLKCRIAGEKIYGDHYVYTTFTGVIIHEL